MAENKKIIFLFNCFLIFINVLILYYYTIFGNINEVHLDSNNYFYGYNELLINGYQKIGDYSYFGQYPEFLLHLIYYILALIIGKITLIELKTINLTLLIAVMMYAYKKLFYKGVFYLAITVLLVSMIPPGVSIQLFRQGFFLFLCLGISLRIRNNFLSIVIPVLILIFGHLGSILTFLIYKYLMSCEGKKLILIVVLVSLFSFIGVNYFYEMLLFQINEESISVDNFYLIPALISILFLIVNGSKIYQYLILLSSIIFWQMSFIGATSRVLFAFAWFLMPFLSIKEGIRYLPNKIIFYYAVTLMSFLITILKIIAVSRLV
jgi:hypothetical protein